MHFIAFPLVAAAGAVGYGGAVYFALSHGFAKAAMFLSAGTLLHVAGHDRIDELDDIAPRLPISMLAFGLAGVSLIGLPPSGGFVAKWLLLEAALGSGQWWWAVVIMAGGLLAGAYVFRVASRAFVPRSTQPTVPGVRPLEWSALVLAGVACIMGLAASLPLSLLPDGNAQLGMMIDRGLQ